MRMMRVMCVEMCDVQMFLSSSLLSDGTGFPRIQVGRDGFRETAVEVV